MAHVSAISELQSFVCKSVVFGSGMPLAVIDDERTEGPWGFSDPSEGLALFEVVRSIGL